MNLLFKITYGLYVLTSEADGKAGGCVINTLSQQTSEPERFSVTVNKLNFTHDLIMKSGKFAVALLSKSVKFDLIKGFGMRSGRDTDKFAGVKTVTAKNGCKVPAEGVIGWFEMKVEKTIDFGTHTMFVASVTASWTRRARSSPMPIITATSSPNPLLPPPRARTRKCGCAGYAAMSTAVPCPKTSCAPYASTARRTSKK